MISKSSHRAVARGAVGFRLVPAGAMPAGAAMPAFGIGVEHPVAEHPALKQRVLKDLAV